MTSGGHEHERALAEIRDEYARRAIAPQCAGQYSFLNLAHCALVFEREQALLAALARHLAVPLEHARVLDFGCGSGLSLALLAVYGADSHQLHGVDLDVGRIERGQEQFPAFRLRAIEGHSLPYDDEVFDLVQQITVLSSVRDEDLRRRLGAEMVRVLKPGGLLLSYDVVPVPLIPRLVNRALTLVGAARRKAGDRVSGADGASHVRLTPVVPLPEPELRKLFPGVETVEVVRLTPYRPLVERVASNGLAVALLRSLSPLSSACLFVGRKQ